MWTDMPPFVLDQLFSYQVANQMLENITAIQTAPLLASTAGFLPNAIGLDALATGYLKSTTGTGVVTTVPTIPATDLPTGLKTQSLTHYVAHFTSPGSGIATGMAGVLMVPWACTITQVTLLSSDPSVTTGSIVIDIWKGTYGTYPPVVGGSICGSAKPTISSGIKSQNTTLTGWSPILAAGDILAFNVDSVTAFTRVRIDAVVTLTA